ncbi:hypothetical protein [Aridibaculum aurantiacum]|uniref:hypothetical protein n=1 Tax=Aridibaculum aurantiacum TaxID=2810307 RepID=UPI001A971653|nr:hypothetical protein [Aridibaculum aurantiacum]
MLRCLSYPVVIVSYFLLVTACSSTQPTTVPQSRQERNLFHAFTTASPTMLQNKNDLHIQTSAVVWQYAWPEVQVAYAPLKNIGVSTVIAGSLTKDDFMFNAYNFSAGYFNKVAPNVHLESYVGTERGTINNTHATGSSKLKLTKYFIQPAIAFSNENNSLHFILMTRFSTNNRQVVHATYHQTNEPFTHEQFVLLNRKPNFLMLEPGFQFRYGRKRMMFTTGYTGSLNFSNSFHRSIGNFNIGFLVRLGLARNEN